MRQDVEAGANQEGGCRRRGYNSRYHGPWWEGARRCPERARCHREFGRGHQLDGETGYKLQKAKKRATRVNRGGGIGIRT